MYGKNYILSKEINSINHFNSLIYSSVKVKTFKYWRDSNNNVIRWKIY